MVHQPRASVVAVGALLAACGALRVPPPFPGAPEVRKVEIVGARQVDPDAIRSRLGTAATGRWPWDEPRRFDPVVWTDDLARIPLIYRAEGFFSARVVSSEVRERDGRVVPTVVVEEGAPSRVVEVALRGIEGLPGEVRERVREAVALRTGEPFREAAWQATKRGVLGALTRSGYAVAALDAEARVDPEALRARAVLELRPGERFRFGAVEVATPVPPGVTRRDVVDEARGALSPDAWYDPAALPEAQARVFRMGVFSAVEVAAGEPDPRTRRVPVSIALRGATGQALSLGAGVGITLRQDDVHATGEWVARGVGDGLVTVRVRGDAGYALVPPIQEALSSFERFPPRRGPFARLVVDADVPRPLGLTGAHLFASTELDLALRPAYRSTEVRPSAGLAWSPARTLQLETSYRLVAADLFDTPLTSAPGSPAAFGCANPCTLSGLDLAATWDTHQLSRPREGGWRVHARLSRRGTPLGGGYDLLSAEGEVSTDQPLSTGQAVYARVGAATAASTGSRPVPALERLSGGGATMRGYGAGRLSPLMTTRIAGGPMAVPVGGRGLLEGTLELRQPLSARTSLVGFADAGAASVGPFAPGRLLSALTWAIGTGIRFRTPIGSLSVEFAYRLPIGPSLPIVSPPGGGAAVPAPTGCFGFGRGSLHGGGPDSPCRIHISLGEVR